MCSFRTPRDAGTLPTQPVATRSVCERGFVACRRGVRGRARKSGNGESRAFVRFGVDGAGRDRSGLIFDQDSKAVPAFRLYGMMRNCGEESEVLSETGANSSRMLVFQTNMQANMTVEEALRLSVLAEGCKRGRGENQSELLARTLSAVVSSRETLQRSADAIVAWGALGPSPIGDQMLLFTR